MRILIISDPITPPSYAPRVMSLFRYLQIAGHEVVLESGHIAQNQSRWSFIADKLWGQNDREFSQLLLHKYPEGHFDIIFCTTYYYFPLLTARCLSQAWHIPYVVDLRDIVEQWGQSYYFTTPLPHLLGLEHVAAKWYEKKNIRLRNRVMQGAKAVITISPWHQQCLQSQTTTPVHLVYNGYDEEEIHFEAQPAQVFSVAYIGRIIKLSLRQPQLLFQAVSEWLQDGKVDKTKLSLDFYAEPNKESEVRVLAAQYGVNEYLHWHAFIGRQELCATIARTSVLIALGCPRQEGQHGILGTKVFEAIGAEKPLLLVPSDEDSLANLIQETGIGCAASSVTEVKHFLQKQYEAWERNGYTHQIIQDKERFNRKAQAQQIEDILQQ